MALPVYSCLTVTRFVTCYGRSARVRRVGCPSPAAVVACHADHAGMAVSSMKSALSRSIHGPRGAHAVRRPGGTTHSTLSRRPLSLALSVFEHQAKSCCRLGLTCSSGGDEVVHRHSHGPEQMFSSYLPLGRHVAPALLWLGVSMIYVCSVWCTVCALCHHPQIHSVKIHSFLQDSDSSMKVLCRPFSDSWYDHSLVLPDLLHSAMSWTPCQTCRAYLPEIPGLGAHRLRAARMCPAATGLTICLPQVHAASPESCRGGAVCCLHLSWACEMGRFWLQHATVPGVCVCGTGYVLPTVHHVVPHAVPFIRSYQCHLRDLAQKTHIYFALQWVHSEWWVGQAAVCDLWCGDQSQQCVLAVYVHFWPHLLLQS